LSVTPYAEPLIAGTYSIVVPATALVSGNRLVFQRWSDGITNPSRNVVLPPATTLTIEYAIQYFVDVSAGAGGYVDPSGQFALLQGESLTITAHSNTGYVFQHWLLDGVVVSTNSMYNMTNILSDHVLIAVFAQGTQPTPLPPPTPPAEVTDYQWSYPSGNYVVSVPQRISDGGKNYIFDRWEEI